MIFFKHFWVIFFQFLFILMGLTIKIDNNDLRLHPRKHRQTDS